jgi:hypothetical protein
MLWSYMGEWRYISTILDLGTKWRWVFSLTARQLYSLEKSPPQNRSARFGEEKNVLPLTGIEPGCPTRTSTRYSICLSIYLSTYLSIYLWLDRLPLFQFLNPIHSQQDSLDGRSARHKSATYTQNNTNRINADINALSGIGTHDPSVRASEDSSCLLRAAGHCDPPNSILVKHISGECYHVM